MRRANDLLDAIDAPGEDLEPYLRGYSGNGLDEDADETDRYGEGDDCDSEPSLGAPEMSVDSPIRIAGR